MTTNAGPPDLWPGDLTLICERLATDLAQQGATHPVAAAVMLAARGHAALSQTEFSEAHGLTLKELQSTEAGHVAWEDLPDIAGHLLGSLDNVSLLALADLETTYRIRNQAAEG